MLSARCFEALIWPERSFPFRLPAIIGQIKLVSDWSVRLFLELLIGNFWIFWLDKTG
jgi:hypothetical protein